MASTAPHRILSHEEVLTVFDSVHDDTKELPTHLTYHVIPVGSSRGKISPPKLHFQGTCANQWQCVLKKILSLCVGCCRHCTDACTHSLTHYFSLLVSVSLDGLYLLCDVDDPNVPEHLHELVQEEMPAASYRWHPAIGRKSDSDDLRYRHCYRYKSEIQERIMDGVCGFLWTKVKSSVCETVTFCL